MIDIGRAYGPADVALLEAAFGATDLPLFLLHRQIHLVSSQSVIAYGGMPICVRRCDVPAASALLAEIAPRYESPMRWKAAFLIAFVIFGFGGGVPMPMNAVSPRSFVRELTL